MRNRIALILLAGFVLALSTGCNGRFCRRGCSSTVRDLPTPSEYCPNR